MKAINSKKTIEGTSETTKYGTALFILRKSAPLSPLFDAYGKKLALKIPHSMRATVIDGRKYAL
jgi:hypothetical protein